MLTSDRKSFDFGILIHGGASVNKIKRTTEITRSLSSAVSYGFDLLQRSSNEAVDSVEAAVASMEDSGLFDAGVGYLTIDYLIYNHYASLVTRRTIFVSRLVFVLISDFPNLMF